MKILFLMSAPQARKFIQMTFIGRSAYGGANKHDCFEYRLVCLRGQRVAAEDREVDLSLPRGSEVLVQDFPSSTVEISAVNRRTYLVAYSGGRQSRPPEWLRAVRDLEARVISLASTAPTGMYWWENIVDYAARVGAEQVLERNLENPAFWQTQSAALLLRQWWQTIAEQEGASPSTGRLALAFVFCREFMRSKTGQLTPALLEEELDLAVRNLWLAGASSEEISRCLPSSASLQAERTARSVIALGEREGFLRQTEGCCSLSKFLRDALSRGYVVKAVTDGEITVGHGSSTSCITMPVRRDSSNRPVVPIGYGTYDKIMATPVAV